MGREARRIVELHTVGRDAHLRLGARHIDREPAGRAKSEIFTEQRHQTAPEQSSADHEHNRDGQLSDDEGAPQAPDGGAPGVPTLGVFERRDDIQTAITPGGER